MAALIDIFEARQELPTFPHMTSSYWHFSQDFEKCAKETYDFYIERINSFSSEEREKKLAECHTFLERMRAVRIGQEAIDRTSIDFAIGVRLEFMFGYLIGHYHSMMEFQRTIDA